MNLSTTNISASDLFYLHMESVSYEYSDIHMKKSLETWISVFRGYKSALRIHLIAAQHTLAHNEMAILLINQYLKEIDK